MTFDNECFVAIYRSVSPTRVISGQFVKKDHKNHGQCGGGTNLEKVRTYVRIGFTTISLRVKRSPSTYVSIYLNRTKSRASRSGREGVGGDWFGGFGMFGGIGVGSKHLRTYVHA